MKRSIAYLPKEKQEDLRYLVKLILERIPQTEMIILYGSYATGKYVDFDTRIEFGIRTTYMSDYDILVVTDKAKDKEVGQRLDNIDEIYYKNPDKQTPVQFINEDIKNLNKALSERRYFYTQIKEEGVMLYNTGNFKLSRRYKLNFEEIRKQAQDYFDDKYNNAQNKFKLAKYAYNEKLYKDSIFLLHQTCENLFYAVRLVYTLENSKQHNLKKLLTSVNKYSEEFQKVFPRESDEEKRLFNLVKSAYVESRYNPDFIVTKEDIDYLFPVMDQLFELVNKICEVRIEQYIKLN